MVFLNICEYRTSFFKTLCVVFYYLFFKKNNKNITCSDLTPKTNPDWGDGEANPGPHEC